MTRAATGHLLASYDYDYNYNYDYDYDYNGSPALANPHAANKPHALARRL